MPIELRIKRADITDPRVVAFLDAHVEEMRRVTPPPAIVHALDLDRLRQTDIRIYAAWYDGLLVGTAALRTLEQRHGEIKSMRTVTSLRGQGIGSAMVRHLIDDARSMGLERLSLETGRSAPFVPAQKLYERHGFLDCGPYGDYEDDPHSRFMTRRI